MKTPCLDCKDRFFDKERGVSCHCECEKYKKFSQHREHERNQRFLQRERQNEVLRRK